MKLLNLRKQLLKIGLVLVAGDGNGWVVTNNGTVKTLSEKKFANLDAVLMWLESLSDAECDEFDAEFCLEEK